MVMLLEKFKIVSVFSTKVFCIGVSINNILIINLVFCIIWGFYQLISFIKVLLSSLKMDIKKLFPASIIFMASFLENYKKKSTISVFCEGSSTQELLSQKNEIVSQQSNGGIDGIIAAVVIGVLIGVTGYCFQQYCQQKEQKALLDSLESEFQSKCEELTKITENMSLEKDKFKAIVSDLESTYIDIIGDLKAEHTQKVTELQALINECKKQLDAAEKDKLYQAKEIKELNFDGSKLKEAYDELLDDNQKLGRTNTELLRENFELEMSNSELWKQKRDLVINNVSLTKTNKDLQKTVDSLEKAAKRKSDEDADSFSKGNPGSPGDGGPGGPKKGLNLVGNNKQDFSDSTESKNMCFEVPNAFDLFQNIPEKSESLFLDLYGFDSTIFAPVFDIVLSLSKTVLGNSYIFTFLYFLLILFLLTRYVELTFIFEELKKCFKCFFETFCIFISLAIKKLLMTNLVVCLMCGFVCILL